MQFMFVLLKIKHFLSFSIPLERIGRNENISQEEAYFELGLKWPPKRLLSLEEGERFADRRLQSLGFQVSPTQPSTLADGNCLMRALVDQIT